LFFLLLTSCLQNEENSNFEEQLIKNLVLKYKFNLEGIKKNVSEGFKVNDLNEFENYLKSISNHLYDFEDLKNLYFKNGIDLEKFLADDYSIDQVSEINLSSLDRIECIQNAQTVYGRLNSGNPLTYIDVTFNIGSGSGLIESFQATLGGLTLGVSLGRNNFQNSQTAGSNNNYIYSGIYTFTLVYSISYPNIGTVYVTEITKWQIRTDGCTGTTHWIQIIE
jgi:hypothetical protein